jgi:hypothetical protein
MRRKLLIAILASLFPFTVYAPGTLPLDDIAAILKQKPELSRPFLEAFDLREWAVGVRLGPHFKHLGGARVGPYELAARARGSHGGYDVKVVICTVTVFLDDRGKKVEMTEATRVEETLRGFIIEPPDGHINCPD